MAGRPKKDPNAPKANYNLSVFQKARRETQKRLREANKKANRLAIKAGNRRKYAETIKNSATKIEKALQGNDSATIDEGDLQNLPNSVQKLVDGREIVFKPNAGPQEDFLSSPERDVLYGVGRRWEEL